MQVQFARPCKKFLLARMICAIELHDQLASNGPPVVFIAACRNVHSDEMSRAEIEVATLPRTHVTTDRITRANMSVVSLPRAFRTVAKSRAQTIVR